MICVFPQLRIISSEQNEQLEIVLPFETTKREEIKQE